MAQSDFTRAQRFLNYNQFAKWSALLAGASTGVLYVGFLLLLILFTDILIYRGAIPTYDHLSTGAKNGFLETDTTSDVNWAERLKQVPSASASGVERVNSLMAKPAKDLSESDKKLRREWLAWWHQKQARVWEKRLSEIGFSNGAAAPDSIKSLASTAGMELSDELTSRQRELRREIRWRWYVHKFLNDNVSASAANFVAERSRQQVERMGAELALDRDIPDCGLLGLILRNHNRVSALPGCWLARFNHWTWQSGIMVYLSGLLIAAIVLAAFRAILMFANKYMAAKAVTEAITRLRRAIYHHTYRLGTLAFRALGPTEAVGVSTRHLESVHDGLYAWLTVYYREPIKFFVIILFALLINPWLTLAFVVLALLVWVVGGQLAAHYRRQGRISGEKAAEQLAHLQESLMLMRLVKVYLMELFNQNRVERQLAKSADAQLKQFRGEAIYRPLLVFLGMVAALLLLFVIGAIVANGQLGVSGAAVLTTALVSLYLPAQRWLENRRFVRRGRDSAKILFEFLDRKGDVGQDVEAQFLPPLEDSLVFKNVHLKEPGTGRKLLRGVNLTIESGQRVALVGPDEMEKHALVYLLPRFLDPSSGEIRIDGKSLRRVTLDSLRAQIAVVLQHNLIFNDTIANNIGCGDKSFTLPQIIDAAKTAHAHQFIQKLPNGYETVIGELGHYLNKGQMFRIALARALLRDPAIMIVEEPVESLDEETKNLLDDTMTRVLPGRTVIFLPHRLSTIRHCDQVFLLFNGEIVDAGAHKDLLSKNDLYRHLQYLEFNEFAGLVGDKLTIGGML